jgi:hypothetical protein
VSPRSALMDAESSATPRSAPSGAPRRIRTYDPRIRSANSDGAEHEQAENMPEREAERERVEAPSGQSGAVTASEPDAVEAALADAIQKAAAAGAFDVLPKLVAELEARRKARRQTVDLQVERAKRQR